MRTDATQGQSASVVAINEAVGQELLTHPSGDNHIVQFYDQDDFLRDTVAHFIGAGLIAGETVIVVATESHRRAFCEQLRKSAIDVERACESGQLTLLDAAGLLSCFLVGDALDTTRFFAALDSVLAGVRSGGARLRAYGEMVDLLWQDGRRDAAVALEALWNQVAAARPLSLLCSYRMTGFDRTGDQVGFSELCTSHTHVLPTERYSALAGSDAQLREISRLQQRAQALESEVALRKRSEEAHAAAERQARTLIDSMPALAWTADAEGRGDFFNRRWYEYTGVTFEAMDGWGWHSVHHPDELPKVIARWNACIQTGEPFEMSFPLRRADGVFRWHLTRALPLRDGAGKIMRWFGTCTDIDDQLRAEKALAEAHHRAARVQGRTGKLHAITAALSRVLSAEEAVRIVMRETLPLLDAAAGGVLLLDAAGVAIERWIIDGEGTGDSDARAVADAQRLSLDANAPICDAARTGKVVWVGTADEIARRYPGLLELRGRSAARAWGAFPLVFEGRTIGSLGFRCAEERQLTVEDEQLMLAVGQQCAQAIERARLYEENRAARAAAEGASQAKDEFMAMLGHELRNPISPIVTALQLMKLRGDVKSTKEQNVIERQVQHLVRLVDDLLDISKITRGKVQLDKRPLELSAIVAKAVEMASPLFEQRGHHFSVSVPRLGMRLDADETRLAQVIANLLTNAAKYTEPGGNITLRAWRDGHEVVVQVKDDGVGIPRELLPRVFDLFVQGYRASDRGQGGLGIGLALVRNLVSLHHGTVTALSDGPGCGSEFVVRLPVVREAHAPEPTSAQAAPREPARCALPRRVLVVDDNEDAAELLAEMLDQVGHEVAVATDGPRALAMLDAFQPEVAVLDIGLPVMDGYELAVKLRERLVDVPLRLIAVTGYGQDHDRARSRKAGFELHFVKPLHPDKLITAIERGDPTEPAR